MSNDDDFKKIMDELIDKVLKDEDIKIFGELIKNKQKFSDIADEKFKNIFKNMLESEYEDLKKCMIVSDLFFTEEFVKYLSINVDKAVCDGNTEHIEKLTQKIIKVIENENNGDVFIVLSFILTQLHLPLIDMLEDMKNDFLNKINGKITLDDSNI